MISVIICSRNEALFSKVAQSIEQTVGLPFEIIKIDNSDGRYGICEAYNIGAAKAKYSFLCFCHEDLLFHTPRWGEKVISHLQDTETGLIGIFGTSLKTVAPSGVWLDDLQLDKVNHLQTLKQGGPFLKYANSGDELKSQVVLIDGMFMCCRQEVWSEFKFDERNIKGFHGYDIDFSLQIVTRYKLYVIYDVDIEHMSEGVYSESWIDAMILLTEKWKKRLPVQSVQISKQSLKELEHRNYVRFLKIMAFSGKPRRQALFYFFKSFALRPTSIEHLKIIRYFFKNFSNN